MQPLLVGQNPTRIEDIWPMATVSPYWRNALSDVDMLQRDIAGKRVNLLNELFGGEVRVYRHADERAMKGR